MSDQTEIDQMIELRRWAKYGRLMSGIIHNLNTPLMGITGRVELIGFKMPDLKGLEQITKQLQRINDILVPLAFLVDKDLNVERTLCDINDLITKVDRLCSANMKYKHRINVELELEGNLLAELYPMAVQNAVYEVCMNAADALPDEGTLRLTTGRSADIIIIKMENDGPAIPEELLPQLGEQVLFATDGRLKLGCYMSRREIETCGGSICWYNEPPGVVCVIELPAAHQASD